MFTSTERHAVSSVLAVAAWLLLSGVGQSPAFGQTNEKGPRCSDGLDNDGDGLIDCADPDCHCAGEGGGGSIPVTVTFRDFPGDDVFPPDGLMSDCSDCNDCQACVCDCPYVDNVDKVKALIDNLGDLSLAMGLPKRNRPQPIRTLFFDFSACASDSQVDCTTPFETGFGFSGAWVWTTGANLRDMNVGAEFSEEVGLLVTLKPAEDGSSWRLFFDPSDSRCPGSSNVIVTRIDTETWEIEAGLSDVACLAEQPGKGLVFSGLYYMPFKITVQIK